MTDTTTPKLLDQKQAAAMLNVAPTTLAAWRKKHGIAHYKVGNGIMYKPEDLMAFIESRRVSAQQARKKAATPKAAIKARAAKRVAAKK